MKTAWLKREGGALVPTSRAAQEIIADLPSGERLKVEIKQSRNDKHHRMFFALLGLCVKALNNGPAPTTTDLLLKWIKVKLGYVKVVELPANIVQATDQSHAIEYQSISYDAMDQDAFSAFADEAMRLVRDQIAPWIVDSREWEEVQTILANARIEDAA